MSLERSERYVIAAGLAYGDTAVFNFALDSLNVHMFEDERHGVIWLALRHMRIQKMTITTGAVTNYLDGIGQLSKAGGAGYLENLTLPDGDVAQSLDFAVEAILARYRVDRATDPAPVPPVERLRLQRGDVLWVDALGAPGITASDIRRRCADFLPEGVEILVVHGYRPVAVTRGVPECDTSGVTLSRQELAELERLARKADLERQGKTAEPPP